jgi:tetratricopeptide (TPR) repeat protein
MISRVSAGGPVCSRDGRVRSGVMPQLVDGFISRAETAPSLGAALVPGTAVVLWRGRVAAGGAADWLDSCGKTQLAVSFAESLWQSGGVDLLFWIAAASRASVLSGYVRAAVAAMGIEPAGDAESVAVRFVSWLGKTSRPWLVVLDDLSDTADLEGLWPEGPTGRVLITTTNPATACDQRQAVVHPVGAFSRRQALRYLTGRLGAGEDQRPDAIDLVNDLGCEPLALAQASAVIANSSLSCHDYREYFARKREQLAEITDRELPPAAVTWALSFERAERSGSGEDVWFLLAFAALLDGNGMPDSLFTTSAVCECLATGGDGDQADRERAWGALLALGRSGVLALDLAGSHAMVRMSRVLQAAVRAQVPEELLERTARAAANALLEVWPEDEPLAWLAEDLRSCAASLQTAAGEILWAGGCHPVLFRLGRSLDAARLTVPAAAYWRDLAAVSERVLGPDHLDTLVASERLAEAYLTAGRAAEAVSWFQWVLAARSREFGRYDPGSIAARRNLGRALAAADQLVDAFTVLDQAVRDHERIHGPDHLETLGTREDLAAVHRAAREPADAIRLYRRTLADRERIQGSRHPDALTTRHKLADTCLVQGQIKEAVSLYKRVLADREHVLGPDHLDTIAARGCLGSAYYAAGRMSCALQLYEQTCEGYERILGADHSDALTYRLSLANAYYKVGRLSDGIILLRDIVARCEQVLSPGDPLTQAARESLTNIGSG